MASVTTDLVTVDTPDAHAEATSKIRACVFALAGEPFAVGIDVTREIVTIDEVTPVPLAPSAVVGVVNLRGTLVPLVDVRPRLGLPPSSGRPKLALLLSVDPVQFAIVIDDVIGLAALDELPKLRETARRRFGDCGLGVTKLGETLPTLLDAGSLARHLKERP